MKAESGYGEELRNIKIEKLEKIEKLGFDPYPTHYDRTHFSNEIIDQFDSLEKNETKVAVAGRIIALRKMGKAMFGHIRDSKGKIQIYVRKDRLKDKLYELANLVDIGDFLGIKGTVFRTRTDEITVVAEEIQLLSKTLLPLPIVKEEEVDGILKIAHVGAKDGGHSLGSGLDGVVAVDSGEE